jgi:hypothetical protein
MLLTAQCNTLTHHFTARGFDGEPYAVGADLSLSKLGVH